MMALALAFACAAGADDSFTQWRKHSETLRQAPSLVRYYLFDEGRGFTVANRAGNGEGTLDILANSPYGMSREQRWWVWGSPFDQVFPSWTEGRWPGKNAMSSGLAGTNVVRSHLAGTKDGVFTLEAWVRMHGDAGRGALFNIGGWSNGWNAFYERAPWIPDGQVSFLFGKPGGAIDVKAAPFAPKVWHQLVCLWDGKALKIFVDGKLAAEKACAGPYIPVELGEAWAKEFPECDTGGFSFGGKPGTERFDVDEIAIFDRALTPAEVAAHYAVGRPDVSPAEQVAAFDAAQTRRKALDSIKMEIPNDTLGIFRRGEKIPAKISVPATAGLEGKHVARFLLREQRNQVIMDESCPLDLVKGKDAVASVELAPERCDIYFLDLWLEGPDGKAVKRLPEEYGLAVTVPLPAAKDIPLSSPLAAHNISGSYAENRFLGFGVDRWIKSWESWSDKKAFNPKAYGEEMEFDRKAGLKIMFCLHLGAPAWAERVPGKKFLLKDMGIWADYCRQMFRAYKDVVAFWEIENEPNAGDLVPPDEYVEFLKIAYKTFKEEDPNSVVVGLAGCPGFLNFNEAVFKLGGAKYFDVLSLHNYTAYPIKTTVKERLVERAIAQLVQYRGERVPVWNSETGFHPVARADGRPMTEDVMVRTYPRAVQAKGLPTFVPCDMPVLTEHDTACWQLQSMLLDLGAGCEKYFMLSGASHYSPGVNVSQWQPTEIAPAIAAVASLLIPSQAVEKLPLSSSSDAGVVIVQKDGRRVAALFSDETPTLSFKVDRPGVFHGMDMLGNPLTWQVGPDRVLTARLGPAPVYILDVPKDFAQLQFLKVAKAPAVLPENGIMEGTLLLGDPLDKPLSATLSPEAPKGARLEVAGRVELKPGQSLELPFRLDGRELKRRRYEIGFQLSDGQTQLGKLSYSFQSEGTIHMVPELAGFDWWKHVPPELCVDEDNVVHGKPVTGAPWVPQWKGPDDLSFTVRMAWRNDDALLVRIDVTDNVVMPVSKENRGLCFKQDCVELFFDGRSLAERKEVYSPGVEQLLVIPNAGKEAAPCDFWFAGNKPRTISAEFVGARSDKGYWIEGAIRPASGAAFRARAGSQFAFDALVDDMDAETAPRKAAMALHGVFNNASDPAKWGRYQLNPRDVPK